MAKRTRLGQVVAPALLMSLGMAPLGAQALGLGNLRVSSALGQPLSARIDLVGATAAEAEIATISLASAEAHQRMGVGSTLGGVTLHFEVKVGGDGHPYVSVTSYQPVREPYIEFIVEALSPTGQVARHYTVLLDPIGAPATATPAGQWATPVVTMTPPAHAAPRARANPFANVGAPKAGATWGPVPPGATLWSIARRVQPSGADLDDVMSAIQRANPEAFINGDPARLLAGSRLSIPQADALRAPPPGAPSPAEPAPVDNAPAPSEVPPSGTPTPTRAEAPAAEAAPAPAATASAPAATEQAKTESAPPEGEVRVLRGEDAAAASQPGTAPGGAAENRIQLLEEALDAAQQQNASLDVRLKALEEQIRTLTELAKGSASGASPVEGAAAPADAAVAEAAPAEAMPETAPAAPAEATPAPPAETTPAVPTAAAPTPPPTQPAAEQQQPDEPSSGSRVYVLAAAAGAGLAGLVLWARRRREASSLALPEAEVQVAQAEWHETVPEPAPAAAHRPDRTAAPTVAAAPLATTNDGFGDPVDTQIDLLTAYVGMADGPSARQIHDEIQRTGNAAQKAQAAALLARLDA
ncbi:MAG: FimV family protein [Immundisolibacter sp.]|uniref:type IV pilus assembly protein FimV n=1 Tax=Immundisolibacter sp. TaxID=1934948 RepID=UPI003D139323